MNTTTELARPDDLTDVVAHILERQRNYREIRIEAIAAEAMQAIEFPRRLHPRGYIGCELHFRQIARMQTRRRFDPLDRAQNADQNELFPDLQEFYPVRGHAGEERRYVKRADLSKIDRAFNVSRMRRASGALAKHADSLEAEGRNIKPAVSLFPETADA